MFKRGKVIFTEHLEAKLLGRALNILSARILPRAERVRSLEANEYLLKISFRANFPKTKFLSVILLYLTNYKFFPSQIL